MAERKLIARSLDDLPAIAGEILLDSSDHRVFAIKGPMGAGKTTLIKAMCAFLGVIEVVSSPTFALVNEYTGRQDDPVYHFDFYRIKKVEEVFDIGYEEYFFSGNYCFIEWPELVEGLLPGQVIEVDIQVGEQEERIFRVNLSELA